ncbi:MAG: membrane protein insertion efficiency factor YidD [Chlamydiota bacterium]
MPFRYLLLALTPCFLVATPGYHEPWGKDSHLQIPKKSKETPPEESTAVFISKKIILFHQRVLSPVDGPRSHFFPCSSRYMKMAMTQHGFIQGFLMGCDRLLRENKDPWVYRNVIIDNKLVKYDPPR